MDNLLENDLLKWMFIFIVLLLFFATIIVVVGMIVSKKFKDTYSFLKVVGYIGGAMMIVAGIISFFPWPIYGGASHIETLIIPALVLLFGTIIMVVGMITSNEEDSEPLELARVFGVFMFFFIVIILFCYFRWW